MATRLAWWLNLDASLELEAPSRYVRSDKLAARLPALAGQMGTLLREGDVLLDGRPVSETDGFLAMAFCPTPFALAALTALGFAPPAAPCLSVLRQVSSRGFAARLRQTLPEAAYVSSMEQLQAHVRVASSTGAWLVKRDFSFAGRERRLVVGVELDVPTLGFARRSFAAGQGLQVEPLLARESDFAQHGYLLSSGELLVGPLMAQVCDLRGVWQSSRAAAADELSAQHRAALEESVVEAGTALARAGYFGPFGVDAFLYRGTRGERSFQPRSEVNARFSMGYPRELLDRALARTVESRTPPGM